MSASHPARLNIYLDEPELRQAVKIAAAKEGVSLSAYCLKAVRGRLVEEGFLPGTAGQQAEAAKALDRLRRRRIPWPYGMMVSGPVSTGSAATLAL